MVASHGPKQIGLLAIVLAAAISAAPLADGSLTTAQSPPAPAIVKIVGDSHKLVLRADGSFVGWGQFQVGQLGPVAGITATGATTGGLVTIALPAKAIDIAAGIRTSCALLEDGTVHAWGPRASG